MSKFVTLGEIMGRLNTPENLRFQQTIPGTLEVTLGGAEASVAASISHFGADATFVTALPNNPLGQACVANLRSQGIDLSHTLMTNSGRLGLYFVEHGVNQRAGQVIYDREHSAFAITPADSYNWNAIMSQANWFMVSGVTPAISENAAEVTRVALTEAVNHKVKIVCDMNYRSKLWQWGENLEPHELASKIMQEFVTKADLLICGRDDAVKTLGISESVSEDLLPHEICKKYPNLKQIAITQRQSISSNHHRVRASLYNAKTNSLHYAPDKKKFYEITNVVDRIGTGDAFTAALLFAIETPQLSKPSTAISFATAAGCLAHSIKGDFNLVTRAEVEALMNGNGTGRIRR